MGNSLNSETNTDCADFVETEFVRLPWFRQLDAATQHEFLAIAKVVSFSADELAQELASPVTRVLFVVSGSFRVQLMDDLGRETFRGTVGRGGAIGLLSIATAERSRIRAEATEPCVALSLTHDQILELGCKSKTFQRAMLELSASLFVRVTAADRKLPVPRVVAIACDQDATNQD